jgi:ribose/xylose/arabinose/galactoside ABC-type transport system permease subunit
MVLFEGLAIIITRGYVISGFPREFLFIGNGVVLGIPFPLIIFLICAVILSVLLNRTPLGIGIYMLGSNPIATLFSGINVRSILLRNYLISGFLAGIAALIMISRFNSAKADYASSYLLVTVLVSVLGGINPAGGFGKITGLVLALVILQMISSGFNLLRVSSYLTIAMWGTILIVVMGFNRFTAKYRGG